MKVFQLLSLFLLSFTHLDASELLSIAKKASGIYVNESKYAVFPSKFHDQMRNTIIVTGTNHGYMNHFYNLICYQQRYGFKVLSLSLDEKTHHEIVTKLANQNVYSYFLRGKGHVHEDSANFRSPQFHLISMRKIIGVRDILELGFHVIFIDPDIAVVEDPIKYFLHENIDFVHSVNLRCNASQPNWHFYDTEQEGNTGLYYVKSNMKTIKLWSAVIDEAPKHREFDDQTIFWRWLRQGSYGPIVPLDSCQDFNGTISHNSTQLDLMLYSNPVVSCPLDGCMFSSGSLTAEWYNTFIESLLFRQQRPITIHANYMIGNGKKMLQLKKFGYWITRYPEPGCTL